MSDQTPPNSLVLLGTRFMALSMREIRAGALCLSILVYALCGSPTPESFGLAEILTGLLLVFAIHAEGVMRAFWPERAAEENVSWENPSRLWLYYGLSIPLAMAVLAGADMRLVIRDLIPFLFLFLPLLAGRLAVYTPRGLILSYIALGVLFSLRALAGMAGDGFPALFGGEALFYLANSPAVLFAAIFLSMQAIERFFPFSVQGWGVSLGLAVLAVLPVLAMGAALQRASIGLFVMVCAFVLMRRMILSPLRGALMAGVFALGMAVLWPYIAVLADMLLSKSAEVGGNMRLQELAAVWDALAGNIWNVLFGLGWGAQFKSPAVGMLSVNFTHSLLSATLLKCGVLGVVCLILYLFEIVRVLAGQLWHGGDKGRLLALALLFPFLIDVFLYAAYKSYDFGLLLLLIVLLPDLREKSPED